MHGTRTSAAHPTKVLIHMMGTYRSVEVSSATIWRRTSASLGLTSTHASIVFRNASVPCASQNKSRYVKRYVHANECFKHDITCIHTHTHTHIHTYINTTTHCLYSSFAMIEGPAVFGFGTRIIFLLYFFETSLKQSFSNASIMNTMRS